MNAIKRAKLRSARHVVRKLAAGPDASAMRFPRQHGICILPESQLGRFQPIASLDELVLGAAQ